MLFTQDELLDYAKAIKCSKTLIDNAEISGLEDDILALEENINETEEYLARERERFDFVDYLAISEEAARISVKQMC